MANYHTIFLMRSIQQSILWAEYICTWKFFPSSAITADLADLWYWISLTELLKQKATPSCSSNIISLLLTSSCTFHTASKIRHHFFHVSPSIITSICIFILYYHNTKTNDWAKHFFHIKFACKKIICAAEGMSRERGLLKYTNLIASHISTLKGLRRTWQYA